MHHIDPIDIGLIVSTMGIGMMIAGPFAGHILKFYGEKIIIVLGSFITGVAAYMQSFITADFIFLDLFPSQLLKGIGAQFLFMGSQFICFSSLNTKMINNASAMYNLIMRLTAAVSIAVSSNYFIKFQKDFFSKITENYTNETYFLKEIAKENMNNQFSNKLLLLSDRESFIMAFNKISFMSFWTAIIPVILLLVLFKRTDFYRAGKSGDE